jgi:ArsR family transcriptional regulator, arsenate/arsenite/antimonite-responsive transcriptional repressor
MGASKSDFFTEQQNSTANLFKALAHPARIAIIEHLINVNSCICGDLVDVLPLSQATVSQHLRELKEAKIIKGSIDGNSICYYLNAETLEQITQILYGYGEKDRACNTEQNKCC